MRRMNFLLLRVPFFALVLLTVLHGQALAEPLVITNLVRDVGGAPRLTIHSDVGRTNRIEYSTNLSLPTWLVLTNLTVTESPYALVDLTAPATPRRFYRVSTLVPLTNMALIPAGAFQMGDALDGITNVVNKLTIIGFYNSLKGYESTAGQSP